MEKSVLSVGISGDRPSGLCRFQQGQSLSAVSASCSVPPAVLTPNLCKSIADREHQRQVDESRDLRRRIWGRQILPILSMSRVAFAFLPDDTSQNQMTASRRSSAFAERRSNGPRRTTGTDQLMIGSGGQFNQMRDCGEERSRV
jgi:hypothetical protein